jgi:AAA ATPase domain
VLAGRDVERARIRAVVDAARAGTGGALVVRGVAGTGKSTLLADAVSSGGDMTVLRTGGVESESPLAFAALQRLLRPLRCRDRCAARSAAHRAARRARRGRGRGRG